MHPKYYAELSATIGVRIHKTLDNWLHNCLSLHTIIKDAEFTDSDVHLLKQL